FWFAAEECPLGISPVAFGLGDLGRPVPGAVTLDRRRESVDPFGQRKFRKAFRTVGFSGIDTHADPDPAGILVVEETREAKDARAIGRGWVSARLAAECAPKAFRLFLA